jgi:hypothetical protein
VRVVGGERQHHKIEEVRVAASGWWWGREVARAGMEGWSNHGMKTHMIEEPNLLILIQHNLLVLQ